MKRMLCCLLSLMLVCLLALPVTANTDWQSAPLSPAIPVLAGGFDLSLWALPGERHELSAEVFERGLNLSAVHSVRICSLPQKSEGILRIGDAVLSADTVLTRENLSKLTFERTANSVGVSSFSFEVNGCAVAYTCRLYTIKTANASPSLEAVPALAVEIVTHKNLPVGGRFYASDPEGDPVSFEVTAYPKYGSLQQHGDAYVYTPYRDYTGEDHFSYVARDSYGNYSASRNVSIEVTAKGSTFVYADVSDAELQNALMTLGDAGIMSGSRVGDADYFYPDHSVARAEFLVMAMSAVGITDLPDCENTGFADDADIPHAMKPYVATAYRLGYVSGTLQNGALVFLPEAPMTTGDAAQLLQKLMLLDGSGSEEVASASGRSSDAAIRSIATLASVGLIDGREIVFANSILTRGGAAKLLAGALFLTNREKLSKTY